MDCFVYDLLFLSHPLLSLNIAMNFFIGDHTELTGFTQVAPRLFLDDGWENVDNIWYKGYSTDCTLSQRLDDIVSGYQPAGKWCVIQDGKIFHPVLRGFPVYAFEGNLTTLKLPNYNTVVYEATAVTEETELSVEEVSHLIGDILVENVENFYRYNNPKNMDLYFSCGLDTLTCWAIQDQVATDYNLILHLSSAKKFIPEYNNDIIKSLTKTWWGHRQVTYKKSPTWTHTGFYAEAYTYRDIGAATGYMKFLGKESLSDLVTEDDYYYGFIDRPRLVEIYNQYKDHVDASTPKKLKEHLWSTIWYDHQIWHLDNSMFFCPFADLRIPKLALRLPIDDLIRISVNGDIQRNIINRFAPEKLSLLSDHKNDSRNVWVNFKKNFNRSMVNENTNFIVL